jgi:hypothetical protein
MIRMTRRFRSSEDGAVLVETAIVMTLLILMLAAFVEFAMIVHWWNQAVKSVQLGARMASVSDPVDSDLKSLDPDQTFATRTCDVDIAQDGTLSGGSCSAGTYDEAALRRIIFGTDDTCSFSSIAYHGMCDVFPSIATLGGTVEVHYIYGGLGYEKRPSGPVPGIRVTLKNMGFGLPVLGSLLDLAGLTSPEFSATSVSDDMSATFVSGVGST